jgi:hypothetical protein
LTDTLAKLARAASINLLLATQKLDRTVIPTSISENVSGRMGFKASFDTNKLFVGNLQGCLQGCEIGRGPHGSPEVGVLRVLSRTPQKVEDVGLAPDLRKGQTLEPPSRGGTIPLGVTMPLAIPVAGAGLQPPSKAQPSTPPRRSQQVGDFCALVRVQVQSNT